MAGPVAASKAIGDALLVLAAPLEDFLALVLPPHWARTMEEPQYPANPYLMCPRLRLHFVQGDEGPGPAAYGQVHDVVYRYSWFYYRRQVPGENHQEALVTDLEAIRNPYLVAAFQPSLQVAGFRYSNSSSTPGVVPGPVTVLTELRHEFDDPQLRVSVGQVDVTVTGSVTNCT